MASRLAVMIAPQVAPRQRVKGRTSITATKLMAFLVTLEDSQVLLGNSNIPIRIDSVQEPFYLILLV